MRMKFLRKKKPLAPAIPAHIAPRDVPAHYQVRSGWGIAIGFNGYETGSPTQLVYGFAGAYSAVGKPHLKDRFMSPMKSGMLAVWEFTEVVWEYDPPDMWTGKVRFIGYTGGNE